MNAKELRQAAEAVKMDAEISLKEELGSLPASYKTIGAFTVKLMDHILSTVRDDDDEPVTDELIAMCERDSTSVRINKTTVTHYGENPVTQLCVVLQDPSGDWVAVDNCKTCGQLRSLCRGLGIELKEVDCV